MASPPLRVHYIQHVPFESLGQLEDLLRARGCSISRSALYAGEPLPAPDDFDWLVIMGGPMGIFDDADYPWLAPEKALIHTSITAGKTVLGICLGAQLIADCLGARVYPGPHREIGWFPIHTTEALRQSAYADIFGDEFEALHWHGDTFELPRGALPLGSSDACHNQGFVADGRIWGLQFHLETTHASLSALVDNCRHELDGGAFVQPEATLLDASQPFAKVNATMEKLVARLFEDTRERLHV